MPRLVFSSDALMQTTPAGRRVYRERADTRLMRLAHPVMRRATVDAPSAALGAAADLRRFTIAAHPDIDAPDDRHPELCSRS